MAKRIINYRKGQRIWSWRQRINFKVPLEVKNRFADAARANNITQSEFGLVLVLSCLKNPELIKKAMVHYITTDFYPDPTPEEVESDSYDPTFGGLFKSSFPREVEHEEEEEN